MANKLVDQSTYEMNDLEAGHATGSSFGTVKVSDDYSETGTAANGLVPSRKALSDAVKVRDITNTLTLSSDVNRCKVLRTGQLVSVQCRFKPFSSLDNPQITGLPEPILANGINCFVAGVTTGTDYEPEGAFTAELHAGGTFALVYRQNTTAYSMFAFTYITSDN